MVLDENFRKMSKSLGNTIDPIELIQGRTAAAAATTATDAAAGAGSTPKKQKSRKFPSSAPVGDAIGVDHLRLWVSSTDFTSDVSIGRTVLSKVGDVMKKYRASARFILGCIDDLDATSVVPTASLPAVDRYLLHLLSTYSSDVTSAYEVYDFKSVFASMQSFNSTHLSAFYLDVSKDRLYADSADAPTRRAAQTTLLHALVVLVKSMAPIMPHLAEDIYQHVPKGLRPFFGAHALAPSSSPSDAPDSIFARGWLDSSEWRDEAVCDRFSTARRVRSHVTKLLESLRHDAKLLTHFSDATVTIEVDPQSPIGRELASLGDDLNEVLPTAAATVRPPSGEPTDDAHTLCVSECDSTGVATPLVIRFRPATGRRCPRCRRTADDVTDDQPCCTRCTQVLARR